MLIYAFACVKLNVLILFFVSYSLLLRKPRRKECYLYGILLLIDSNRSETVTPQQPHVPQETIPVAPLLDVNTLTEKCNCALFPVTNGIFLTREEEESQDEGKKQTNNENNFCNSNIFVIKMNWTTSFKISNKLLF